VLLEWTKQAVSCCSGELAERICTRHGELACLRGPGGVLRGPGGKLRSTGGELREPARCCGVLRGPAVSCGRLQQDAATFVKSFSSLGKLFRTLLVPLSVMC
jgi:hypothetical protein